MTGHIQSRASSQSRVQSNIEGWSHLKKSKERAAPSPALGTSPRRLSRSRVRSLGAIGHRAPSSATMLARGKLRGQGWHITRVAPPFCQSLGTQFHFRNHPLPFIFLCVLSAWKVEKAQGQAWHDLSKRTLTLLVKHFPVILSLPLPLYTHIWGQDVIAINCYCHHWDCLPRPPATTGSCEVRGGATLQPLWPHWLASATCSHHSSWRAGLPHCLLFHAVSPTPTLQPPHWKPQIQRLRTASWYINVCSVQVMNLSSRCSLHSYPEAHSPWCVHGSWGFLLFRQGPPISRVTNLKGDPSGAHHNHLLLAFLWTSVKEVFRILSMVGHSTALVYATNLCGQWHIVHTVQAEGLPCCIGTSTRIRECVNVWMFGQWHIGCKQWAYHVVLAFPPGSANVAGTTINNSRMCLLCLLYFTSCFWCMQMQTCCFV